MPGRHQVSSGARARMGWIAAALAVVLAAATVLGMSPAGASTTVRAQLTLTGLANADNPVGGSQIGIHPGDTVTISPTLAPTAGLDKLGLGAVANLVSGLLGGLANFQVTADFSKLPGGKTKTVIKSTTKPISFTFSKAGTYNFTWSAQRLTLLGIVPINLDGNQLEKAGVKLNASNQYVGQIVVATNPPKGGIGLQLPSIGVHPSVPVLGQLPPINIPGVQVTVPVSVPNLNPSKPATGGKPGTKPGKSSTSTGLSPIGNVIPVPAQVVPRGNGNAIFGDGGFNAGALPGTGAQLANGGGIQPLGIGSGTSTKAASSPDQTSTGKHKTIDLASGKASTGQLSVVLAIIAIIALTLVAATYARLYVIRR